MARLDKTDEASAATAKCTCPTFDGEQAILISCPVHGYPGYPTGPSGDATPADPGAIDLEPIRARHCEQFYHGRLDPCQQAISNLIAAVEALREDLAGYHTVFDLAQKRERPWIEAWREATGKHDTLPDYGKLLAWICDRAEAAEAREAALAGALEGAKGYAAGLEAAAKSLGLLRWCGCCQEPPHISLNEARDTIRALAKEGP